MRRACDPDDRRKLWEDVVGLGDRSGRKSYYPLLRARLAELERFRALLDESSDAIVLIELRDMSVIDTNATACRMLGLSRDELIGKAVSRFSPALVQVLAEIERDGTRRTFETTLTPQRGPAIPVETTASIGRSGGSWYAVASSRDISSRVEAERALMTAERRARAVFEGAAIGLLVLDVSGRIREANSVYHSLVGGSAPEILGQHFSRFAAASETTWLCGHFERLISGVDRLQVFETRWTRLDGSEFAARITASLLSPERGTPALVVASIEDVSARKQVEEERARLVRDLETANRLKDDFLTGLSHELRTPLTCILAWTPLLGRPRGSESLHRGLAAVDRNARKLAQMIDDLLDISCLIGRDLKLETEPIRLAEIVKREVDQIRPHLVQKRIALEVDLGDEDAMVSGDRARLGQVFFNLLENAAKFTPESGRVQVRLVRRSECVEAVVADNGRGISADVLPHIFEYFGSSGSRRTSSSRNKLGLGLAIAHGVVALHGGTIRAESSGPGMGSRFTVTLPRLATAIAAPTLQSEQASSG